jgi:hypothetical protein
MAGLLGIDGSSDGEDFSSDGWIVGTVSFKNAAAKFWPSLMDEVNRSFPAAATLELSSTGACRLDRNYLFPDIHMQQDMDRLLADPNSRLEDVLAELEMTGPPSGVRLRVLRNGTVAHDQELPTDSLDAETFPYLLVWLLEWGGIRESEWNEADVPGRFIARDCRSRREYGVEFVLRSQPLSEGLFRLTVQLNLFPNGTNASK